MFHWTTDTVSQAPKVERVRDSRVSASSFGTYNRPDTGSVNLVWGLDTTLHSLREDGVGRCTKDPSRQNKDTERTTYS